MLHVPKKALILARNSGLRPQDVFQVRTRTGTGAASPQSVGWRPDFVWSKRRDNAQSHYLFDRDRGANVSLSTDSTNPNASLSDALNSFDVSGYTLGGATSVNGSGTTYVDFLFREAPKFFKKGSFTHSNGSADNIDLSSLGVVGMVIVKATNAASNWGVWHRYFAAGNNAFLNTTDAASSTNAYISVSGTTMSYAAGAPGAVYEYYAFAHQPTGIIQCVGANTGSSQVATFNLGWDTQFCTTKSSSTANSWGLRDTVRGFDTNGAQILLPNTTDAEATSSSTKLISGGFTHTNTANLDIFSIAIKKAV